MRIMHLILQVYKAVAAEVAGNLVSHLSCFPDSACKSLLEVALANPRLSLHPLMLSSEDLAMHTIPRACILAEGEVAGNLVMKIMF